MKPVQKTSENFLSLDYQNPETFSPAKAALPTSFAFECFGVRIKICLNQYLPIFDWQNLLPPASKEINNSKIDYVFSIKINQSESALSKNGVEKLRFPGDKWVFEALRGELKSCVSQNSSERVFIHAGVVAWQNRIILIPGTGFAGKTTLTAELVKAGALYYSDDMAIVDRDGLVYPYPKPLSIRQKKSSDGAQIDYDVTHFNGVQAINPLPVGLVVITEYKHGARWNPQFLSAGQGALEILKHTVNSLQQPELSVQVLQKIVVKTKIIKSERGEAVKAARAILQYC